MPKTRVLIAKFPSARRQEHAPRLPLIGSMTPTCGTQDVNDPRAALRPHRGARGGVVHVLGSVSVRIGTAVRGGIERRPIYHAPHSRNALSREGVAVTASGDPFI